MTTPATTPAATARQHQQPCFCDTCWGCTIGNLIGERAVLIQAALTDRLYTDGLEQDMADEIVAVIPAGRRLDVLRHMLTFDHLMPRVMAVDCLLDECDARSYQALEQMGAVLLDAIQAEGSEGRALRRLIINEICDPIVAEAYSRTPVRPVTSRDLHPAAASGNAPRI